MDLYGVKVLHQYPDGYYGYVSDIIKGIEWSVTNGIKVMNMSLGGDIGSQALKKASEEAPRQAKAKAAEPESGDAPPTEPEAKEEPKSEEPTQPAPEAKEQPEETE